MNSHLEAARKQIAADPVLKEFSVIQDGRELHLAKGDVSFARLIPETATALWRIEYFHNEKRWERIDFTGTLKQCLELLAASPHYLFWER